MKEIKVGEYVRTKDGKIIKFNKFGTLRVGYKNPEYYKTIISGRKHYKYDNIVKHSTDIIDLVQVGDIIEWYSEIYRGYYGINEVINRFGEIGVYPEEFDALLNLKNLIIKSIVTKEQFNQVKYEV